MFLFKVQDKFLITGRGLILTPGIGNKKANIGDAIKIIKPDQTIIESTIRGIGFNEFRDILVGNDLTKDDVPIGPPTGADMQGKPCGLAYLCLQKKYKYEKANLQ